MGRNSDVGPKDAEEVELIEEEEDRKTEEDRDQG